jgi:hypothetical protein
VGLETTIRGVKGPGMKSMEVRVASDALTLVNDAV